MAEYVPNELISYHFVPAIANEAAPTVTEITAGTDLTASLADPGAFTMKGATVDRPSLTSRVISKIAGTISLDDVTLQFFDDDDPASDAATIKSTLTLDTTGYIVRFFPKSGTKQTIAAAATCEVWPVQVLSNSMDAVASGEIQKFSVALALTKPPTTDAVVAT